MDTETSEEMYDVFILGGQSNMAGRGGVHRLDNGEKAWDGLGPCFGASLLSA